MTKKCPPGVICFENITLIIFLVIAGIIIYLAYSQTNRAQNVSGPHSHSNIIEISHKGYHGGGSGGGGGGNGFLDLIPSFGSGYTRGPADVLLNPYTPPLRDNRFNDQLGISALDGHSSGGGGCGGGCGGGGDIRGGIPINVPTRSVNTAYRQVGILTRVNGPETILSLMGRPLFPSRDRWQFYTMSDKNQSVKLPVTHKRRSCTSEQGCDNIYNGDTVYVEGYNDAFKATVYDNAMQYSIPYF
jgi:hypothetical protein